MNSKSKGGRPIKVVDEKQIEQLAAINCSYEEIASVVGVDPSTLTRRYAQAIQKGRARGRTSLKRAQWKVAVEKEVPVMLIWLGKQMLGQTDKQEIKEHSTQQHDVVVHEVASILNEHQELIKKAHNN